MSEVYVIERGNDPRPAKILHYTDGGSYIHVRFTDERGGERLCRARSVHATKAEAVRAEKEMERK